MRRILVTNDDGYRFGGIMALADALRPLGEVTIVAPMTEASAIGHALTLRRPLRLEGARRPLQSDCLFSAEKRAPDSVANPRGLLPFFSPCERSRVGNRTQPIARTARRSAWASHSR